MTTNLLLPPTALTPMRRFWVFQIDRAHPMSGSNAMCVVTALLETGMVAMREPDTVVRPGHASGPVVVRAECGDGRCRGVSLDMTPSFAGDLHVRLVASNVGTMTGDVAVGGFSISWSMPNKLV